MNWGWGILISIILFFGLMGYLLYRSSQVDFSLVTEDYYEKELKFGDQIKKSETYIEDGHAIDLKIDNKIISIDFGKQVPDSGALWIYSPRGSKFDEHIGLEQKREVSIDLSSNPVGKYILKFDYYKDGKGLYTEKTVFLK